jgi:hypothetical protein
MCAPSSLSQASTRSKHCHPGACHELEFCFFIPFFTSTYFPQAPAFIQTAAPQAPAFIQTAAQGAKKAGKVHAGPGRPPAKTYEATDVDMRGTRSITEFFGRDQHKSAEKGELPRLTVPSTSSSSAHPSTSGASAEPITSSTSASSAQPSTTASAASGVLAAAAALPAALLHAASSGLAALTAYASGSEDEVENHAAPAIDVKAAALITEEQRV